MATEETVEAEVPNPSEGDPMMTLLDYSFHGGVNLKDRTLLIQEVITPKTFQMVHAFLCEMEITPEPVRFLINSEGGDLAVTCAIIARMREAWRDYDCAVNTRGYGEVYSAAFLILAAGEGVREVTEEASAMYHSFSYGNGGELSEHRILLEETERRTEFWCKWLAKRSKRGVKFWRKISSRGDCYFGPEDLLSMGVVEKIV